MKLNTMVFVFFAGLGMLGYLCYDWLILGTLSSEKGFLAFMVFTNLFIQWLLPILIGSILLSLELVKKRRH